MGWVKYFGAASLGLYSLAFGFEEANLEDLCSSAMFGFVVAMRIVVGWAKYFGAASLGLCSSAPAFVGEDSSRYFEVASLVGMNQ